MTGIQGIIKKCLVFTYMFGIILNIYKFSKIMKIEGDIIDLVELIRSKRRLGF